MIYAEFESILAPDGNEKRNINEFYLIKYQKHIVVN